jgi:hypothetical protein
LGLNGRQISEDQARLLFECEDDSTLKVKVVVPGPSEIVRDKNHLVDTSDELRAASLTIDRPIFLRVRIAPLLLSFRHFGHNNGPIRQQNDEKHIHDWSFDGV